MLTLLRSSHDCKSSAFEFERPSIHNPTNRRIASHRELGKRYQAILETWTEPEIRSANRTPIEFIYVGIAY